MKMNPKFITRTQESLKTVCYVLCTFKQGTVQSMWFACFSTKDFPITSLTCQFNCNPLLHKSFQFESSLNPDYTLKDCVSIFSSYQDNSIVYLIATILPVETSLEQQRYD